MAKSLSSLLFLVFLANLVCYMRLADSQKTWCMAKPSSNMTGLSSNIDYVCIEIGLDCSVIQPGQPCFEPDNIFNHASVAMNLYYQTNGRNPWNCFFNNSGVIVTTDPSYGNCFYA